MVVARYDINCVHSDWFSSQEHDVVGSSDGKVMLQVYVQMAFDRRAAVCDHTILIVSVHRAEANLQTEGQTSWF